MPRLRPCWWIGCLIITDLAARAGLRLGPAFRQRHKADTMASVAASPGYRLSLFKESDNCVSDMPRAMLVHALALDAFTDTRDTRQAGQGQCCRERANPRTSVSLEVLQLGCSPPAPSRSRHAYVCRVTSSNATCATHTPYELGTSSPLCLKVIKMTGNRAA